MRVITVLLFTSVLSGCFIGAQTLDEMYNKPAKFEACYDMELKDAYHRILAGVVKAHDGKISEGATSAGGSIVSYSSRDEVEYKYESDTNATVAVKTYGGPGHHFYTFVYKLVATTTCGTQLSAYTFGLVRKDKFKSEIESWLFASED